MGMTPTPLVLATTCLIGVALLAGCGGDADSGRYTTKRLAPSEATASVVTTQAEAVVVALDPIAVVDNTPADCDALPGKYGQLHNGAVVTLRGMDGTEYGTAEMETSADLDPPSDQACAWLAVFDGIPGSLGMDAQYVATIGPWESDPLSAEDLFTTRLVVNVNG